MRGRSITPWSPNVPFHSWISSRSASRSFATSPGEAIKTRTTVASNGTQRPYWEQNRGHHRATHGTDIRRISRNRRMTVCNRETPVQKPETPRLQGFQCDALVSL